MYQFSLRSLLIFVSLLTAPLAYLGIVAARSRHQHGIVGRFEQCGVKAEYRFGYVTRLWLYESRGGHRGPSDDELANVKGLVGLRYLYLNSPNVTDAGLIHVSSLTGLQVLGLDRVAITDQGLERLKALRNLTLLVLDKTLISDEAVKNLQDALPKCTVIKDGACYYAAGAPK